MARAQKQQQQQTKKQTKKPKNPKETNLLLVQFVLHLPLTIPLEWMRRSKSNTNNNKKELIFKQCIIPCCDRGIIHIDNFIYYLLHEFILRKNTYTTRPHVSWYMYSCAK